MTSGASAIPPGLAGVRLLADEPLAAGQRWIFSAGFNVADGPGGLGRVDTELADLARLSGAGARVALLTHQGRHADGSARHLGDLATYLGGRLGCPVRYLPWSTGPEARAAVAALRDGEIALFGNTRLHAGEERNDPDLAVEFAALGERVAMGGFSKAHRRHASTTGLLGLLPGWAADSLVRELTLLGPWAGRDPTRFSVAVVGGRKQEKVEVGLRRLGSAYDLVIPGGAVLNCLLAARGHPVAESVLGDSPARAVEVAAEVLAAAAPDALHLPEEVAVARPDGSGGYGEARWLRLDPRRPDDGVPPGYAVVDFTVLPWALAALDRLVGGGGRAVVAGPPSAYRAGHRRASDQVLTRLAGARDDVVLLGGDTVAELPWSGPTSTGGGSALRYLAEGGCAVLDALRDDDDGR
ncbi:phosphoglycerate kinase [Actinoalloteichus caeruleus]|uniref:phosphoglycerate kinase n=1 Tax=Actinoalloteichus cyanogriseus TaxID=2893586 RepID=UPI003BB8F4AC